MTSRAWSAVQNMAPLAFEAKNSLDLTQVHGRAWTTHAEDAKWDVSTDSYGFIVA